MIATIAVLVFAVWLRWLPALSFASDVTGMPRSCRGVPFLAGARRLSRPWSLKAIAH
jgi:hypothetical protein